MRAGGEIGKIFLPGKNFQLYSIMHKACIHPCNVGMWLNRRGWLYSKTHSIAELIWITLGLTYQTAGKQKGGLVMKSHSSPPTSNHSGLSNNPSSTSTNSSSSSIGSHSASSSPSPSHASRVRLKSGDRSPLTGSPKTSPATTKANKVNSLTVAGLSSKPSGSKSKDSVNAVSSSKV